MIIDLVVTRHQGFVEYLKKHNIISEECHVIRKATPDNVKGKNVIGLVPFLNVIHCCNSYTEIKLDLPYKVAGKELPLEDFERHFESMETYRIEKYSKFKEQKDFIENIVNYLMCSDYEWKFLEVHLKEGGDPFDHILFDVCSRSSNLEKYTKYVEKCATERNRERFEAYMDGLRRGYDAA